MDKRRGNEEEGGEEIRLVIGQGDERKERKQGRDRLREKTRRARGKETSGEERRRGDEDEDVSFSGLLLPTCGSCGFLISLNSSGVLIRGKMFVGARLGLCLLPSQTLTWPELSLRGASRREEAPTSRSPPLRSPQQRADWWSRQHPVKQKPDGQFNDQVTSV